MLNRLKLLNLVQSAAPDFQQNYRNDVQQLARWWDALHAHPEILIEAQQADASTGLPSWQGLLWEQVPVQAQSEPYAIAAIDGSQIYPERHIDCPWFVINIGSVQFSYEPGPSRVFFRSEPHLFSVYGEDGQLFDQEMINCQRNYHELRAALSLPPLNEHKQEIFLFDGSLLLWNVEQLNQSQRQYYRTLYFSVLHCFFEKKLPVAWYVSWPKNNELMNVVRYCAQKMSGAPCSLIALTDKDLLAKFLKPYHRTIVFQSKSACALSYPPSLRPYFFYLNVIDEIARVEIPAWIAVDQERVDLLAAVIVDQVKKGDGYPVCIAEAHEQAVVKSSDRDFFYQIFEQMSVQSPDHSFRSPKSRKKRGMAI